MKELWYNPVNGMKLRRELETNLSQFEVCLESIPTLMILFIYGLNYRSVVKSDGSVVVRNNFSTRNLDLTKIN